MQSAQLDDTFVMINTTVMQVWDNAIELYLKQL